MNKQNSVVEPKQDVSQWSSIVHCKLLKGDDVASALRISRSQAFSLMKQGAIKTVRFGKIVRVREEDLMQFIDNNRTEDGQSYTSTRPAALTASLAFNVVNSQQKKGNQHD